MPGPQTPRWRAAPYCVASRFGSEVWETSLGQNESKILVDSQEEVSSEKTEQRTSWISKISAEEQVQGKGQQELGVQVTIIRKEGG